MCNIKLAMLMLFFSHFVASAQFYTITRDNEIVRPKLNHDIYEDEIKKDSCLIEIVKDTLDNKVPYKENCLPDSLKDQKSQGCRLPHQTGDGDDESLRTDLPELTIPNLIAEIKRNNIKYPKIVLAQAILETG